MMALIAGVTFAGGPVTVTTVIQPNPADGKDAFTSTANPDDNFAIAETISCGNDGSDVTQLFIQFDVSSIPSNAFDIDAKLELWGNTFGLNDVTCELAECLSPWGETSISENNRPNVGSTASGMLARVPGYDGWWEYSGSTLDSIVEAWVSLSRNNNGVSVRLTNGNDIEVVNFVSSDTREDAYKRPKLTVTYSLPGPTPTPTVTPSPTPPPQLDQRVIIVAGGGPYVGNAIINETRALADYAYEVAISRGFDVDDIFYLSSFETPAENDNVDLEATTVHVQNAITSWASGADRLFLLMIDHGIRVPGPDQTADFFYLVDNDASPAQVVDPKSLDLWLTDFQEESFADVVVMLDMCYAGGFIPDLSYSSKAGARAVLTSTTADRLASFGGIDGTFSFCNYFLVELANGRNIEEAFFTARDRIRSLKVPPKAPQRPLLDDNGNGGTDEFDGGFARTVVFGNGDVRLLETPEITDARPNVLINDSQDVELWVETNTSQSAAVSAYVSYEGGFVSEGEPVNNQLELELMPGGASPGRWSATLPASRLPREGIYRVTYILTVFDSLTFAETTGTPVVRTVQYGTESVSSDIYDIAFNDDTPQGTLNYVLPGVPQYHTLDSPTDPDWFVFPVPQPGFFYTVNVRVADEGSNINPRILVMDGDNNPVSTNCAGTSPGNYDCNPTGQSESYVLPNDKALFYIRVDHGPETGTFWGSDAGYTFDISGGAGDTLGVGTIGTNRYAEGGGKAAKTQVPQAARRGVTLPAIYEKTVLNVPGQPSPTFTEPTQVTFGAPFDIYACTKRFEAVAAWFDRTATAKNYSLVLLQVGNLEYGSGPTSFSPPLSLDLQMEDNTSIPRPPECTIEIDDIPPGYDSTRARIMVWNPSNSQWEVFDAAPTFVGDGTFRTQLSDISRYVDTDGLNQVYFGVEPLLLDIDCTDASSLQIPALTTDNWIFRSSLTIGELPFNAPVAVSDNGLGFVMQQQPVVSGGNFSGGTFAFWELNKPLCGIPEGSFELILNVERIIPQGSVGNTPELRVRIADATTFLDNQIRNIAESGSDTLPETIRVKFESDGSTPIAIAIDCLGFLPTQLPGHGFKVTSMSLEFD